MTIYAVFDLAGIVLAGFVLTDVALPMIALMGIILSLFVQKFRLDNSVDRVVSFHSTISQFNCVMAVNGPGDHFGGTRLRSAL